MEKKITPKLPNKPSKETVSSSSSAILRFRGYVDSPRTEAEVAVGQVPVEYIISNFKITDLY